MPRNVDDRASRLIGSLRSLAMVVIQHATKLLAAFDLAFRLADFLAWIDQLVCPVLDGSARHDSEADSYSPRGERVLTEEDHSRKTHGFNAQMKPFRCEFKFGLFAGNRTGSTPASSRIVRNVRCDLHGACVRDTVP